MIGILEHIDGRKLRVTSVDGAIAGIDTFYLRKGFDASTLLHLLQSEVLVETVEEKGFQMVESIKPIALTKSVLITELPKPTLPKTAVEKTKPVDMQSSANVPKLNFGRAENFTGVVGDDNNTVKMTVKVDNRSQKDKIITASWAMGAVLNSPALAQSNDALALSTQQTLERAKRIAEELIKWAEAQSVK